MWRTTHRSPPMCLGVLRARLVTNIRTKLYQPRSSYNYATKTPQEQPIDASLEPLDTFPRRHIGPSDADISHMLQAMSLTSLDELVEKTVPGNIRLSKNDKPDLAPAMSESRFLRHLGDIAASNQTYKNYLGLGYHATHLPPVLQRMLLENPAWYTPYTPYQAEISQGRLTSLLNFQTMVCDLTGLPVANASLLDEATAAAEAMAVAWRLHKASMRGPRVSDASTPKKIFLVDTFVHPQSLGLLRTRAKGFGIDVVVMDLSARVRENREAILEPCQGDAGYQEGSVFGLLMQYPNTNGHVDEAVVDTLPAIKAKYPKLFLAVGSDLLALTCLKAPGEVGADCAYGNVQRFGVPLGFGGPHAAFFALAKKYQRHIPGRLVGMSKDATGKPALRLALQTREQHIRREGATSNICTAQALLANISAMYAVYHGPKGLKAIAERTHTMAHIFALSLQHLGHSLGHSTFFDTVMVKLGNGEGTHAHTKVRSSIELCQRGYDRNVNIRAVEEDDSSVVVAFDETTNLEDLYVLFEVFGAKDGEALFTELQGSTFKAQIWPSLPLALRRNSPYLTNQVFNAYHSEVTMTRYIHMLVSKDLTLLNSMIPLGSCTMKLNAAAEMLPLSWHQFGALHPACPLWQAKGYEQMLKVLIDDLRQLTGFDDITLQPNSGAQGEYTGLSVIRAYHESRGDIQRDVCLIPVSAHGTNPATAGMVGFKVVPVTCASDSGNLDLADVRRVIHEYGPERIAAIMVTYPSTYGVFEDGIKEVCDLVHEAGGQVYMDGANLNAQLGLCHPAGIGADVCHLNLHKTFCIPHGGGGPGMGPVGCKFHLAPFLPGHTMASFQSLAPSEARQTDFAVGPVSGAPYGSASILPISYGYIRMMGAEGLKRATEIALLGANYMAKRLAPHYRILYANEADMVAHEFIIDLRPFQRSAGIEAVDVAKRLQDYGFHSPTMSWPVANTLMIEPTESEDLAEMDRFCDAMISIRKEISQVQDGHVPRDNNLLVNAPHTIEDSVMTSSTSSRPAWKDRPYTVEEAVYPLPFVRENKFWPSCSRLDDVAGDRNLICVCPSMEDLFPPDK